MALVITIPCKYEGLDHIYPDDWTFSDGGHPGADPRWRGKAYTYYDQDVVPVWSTSVPTCDDHAVDYFTFVAETSGRSPVWVAAEERDADGRLFIVMLPWTYDKTTDTATETKV